MTRISLCVLATILSAAAASAQDTAIGEYYHVDALGSVRVVTDATGQVVRTHKYLPFGQELATTAGTDARRFTAKERDKETGLDYFGARHYSPAVGRFSTIDPVMDMDAARLDPQRWNRYAYSLNNPLTYVDPDGRNPRAVWERLITSPIVRGAMNHPMVERLAKSPTADRLATIVRGVNSRLFDLSWNYLPRANLRTWWSTGGLNEATDRSLERHWRRG